MHNFAIQSIWDHSKPMQRQSSRDLLPLAPETLIHDALLLNFASGGLDYPPPSNASIVTLIPDAMLLIRVNAVYAWDVRTLLLTSVLFIIQMATSLIVGVLAVSSAQVYPRGSYPVTGCPVSLTANFARFTLVAWVPSIISQATYFLIMLNTLANLIRSLDIGTATSPASASAARPALSPSRLNASSLPPHSVLSDSQGVTARNSGSTQHSAPVSPLPTASSSTSTRNVISSPPTRLSLGSNPPSRSTPSPVIFAQPFSESQAMPYPPRRSEAALSSPKEVRLHSSPHEPGSNIPTPKSSSHVPKQGRVPPEANKGYATSPLSFFYLFSWNRIKQVKRLVPTMIVFISHGGWYFTLGILAKIANVVMIVMFTGPLQSFAIPFMMALYPITVTRIYLSMVYYLHYRVPMKGPRLVASYDGQDFASGFSGDEDDYIDDDYDYDDVVTDDAYNQHGIETTWEIEERLTMGRLRFDERRYDGRGGIPARDKGKDSARDKQLPHRRNSDMRSNRIRGPRLGRITFAVRESLATSSVLDLGFLRDEEF
ncbi:hypothetical protein JR316_0012580 [Psilocybe cubensis]|uniref:Uncharacterized protein n=2 Tax=Psilocybe cubensis TaxID=181762 RepID=A0A8H7XNM9_PSICU|nr:hypothetical protein JR316_0012580 [Psilocybe cubensis]KAH9475469.1 hypothetical protein JR316_0012580 [Psilocybe cubensis]